MKSKGYFLLMLIFIVFPSPASNVDCWCTFEGWGQEQDPLGFQLISWRNPLVLEKGFFLKAWNLKATPVHSFCSLAEGHPELSKLKDSTTYKQEQSRWLEPSKSLSTWETFILKLGMYEDVIGSGDDFLTLFPWPFFHLKSLTSAPIDLERKKRCIIHHSQ